MAEFNNEAFEAQFTKAHQKELKAALQEFNWKDATERQAFAEIIVNMIYTSIEMEDMTSLLADVVHFELKDRMQFGHLRGIKAFVHEPGSYAPKSVLVKKTLDLYEKMTSINPTINLIELDSGRYGDLVDIKREAKDEILGSRYTAIWNTLVGSIASTDTGQYTTMDRSGTLAVKKTTIDTALTHLRDIGSAPKAIVGRYSVLDWITDIEGYSEKYKEMRDVEGLLGAYKGVPIVYLQQYLDGYGQIRINDSNIMLVADGTVKVGIKFELDKYVMEDINVNTYDWNMHAAEMTGVGVVHSEKNYRIQVTGS